MPVSTVLASAKGGLTPFSFVHDRLKTRGQIGKGETGTVVVLRKGPSSEKQERTRAAIDLSCSPQAAVVPDG
ncbi:hypothetical protein N7507_007023 [Penicillium longicatenatum]|nr:hypothetical protein N7507_007023 [Penicillium longicatenatum]